MRTVKFSKFWNPEFGSILIPGHPLNIGLVGCWLFNERGGTTLRDLSRDRNNLTLTNSPTLGGVSQFGQVITFNGSSNYAGIDNYTAEDMGGNVPFSLSCWIKTTQTPGSGNYAGIVGKGYLANTNGYGLLLNGDQSNHIHWQTRTGASVDAIGGVVNDGNWHFIMGVRDAPNNNNILYVDTVSPVTANGALTDTGGGNQFAIGCRDSAGSKGYYYAGSVAHVRLYNRVVSQDEYYQLLADPFCMIEKPRKMVYFYLPEPAGYTDCPFIQNQPPYREKVEIVGY